MKIERGEEKKHSENYNVITIHIKDDYSVSIYEEERKKVMPSVGFFLLTSWACGKCFRFCVSSTRVHLWAIVKIEAWLCLFFAAFFPHSFIRSLIDRKQKTIYYFSIMWERECFQQPHNRVRSFFPLKWRPLWRVYVASGKLLVWRFYFGTTHTHTYLVLSLYDCLHSAKPSTSTL